MEVNMVKKKTKVNKEASTAIRLSIPSELWRKFRAGCLYMDKDVNSELNRLLENWVKEWHKRMVRPESLQGEQSLEYHNTENNPFSAHSDHSGTGGKGGDSI
jgi:hypothetical protein